MHPVSVERGVSWLPATITITAFGSACMRRENCVNAWRIAGFVGRTVWNTSPAMSTTSGASSMTRSIARAKRRRDVRLPLIDPGGSQPLVLPEAEMEVGEVDEAQGGNLAFER